MREPTETTFAWCCSRPAIDAPGVQYFIPNTASRTRAGSQQMATVVLNESWKTLYRGGWRCERVSIRPFGSGADNG